MKPLSSFSITRSSAAIAMMLAAGAPLAGVLAPVSAVVAQEGTPARVDPYVVIVTGSGIPIRANNSTVFYPIQFTKPGDALVVDGETSGWFRVMYPAGLHALVTPEEAQETSKGTVRLTRASKLRAPNANSGVKGAFYGAVESELPIGTELKLFDSVKDDGGKVTFYWVEAPAAARGWISRDVVRRATDSEAAPLMAKLGPAVAATPVGHSAGVAAVNTGSEPPAAAQPASTPAPTTGAPPAAAPADGGAAQPGSTPPVPPPTTNPPATTPPTLAPATNPPVAPAPDPAAPTATPAQPTATPVATPPGMEIPATIPVGDKGSPRSTVPPAAGGPATLDSLKELYNKVRAQPAATAEYDQAIAEFERFKGTLSSSQRDASIGKQLDAYIAVMKMRKDVRDMQSANAAVNRDTELMKSDVGKKVIELEKQRVYTLIGRLVRSTVYDGGRTPELYRVMSPEPGSARTLGYLLPDPKFDYANKLEQVVGIIGELRPDESLRTNLIVPKRVDVVSLAPIVMSPDIPGVVVKPSDSGKPTEPKADKPSPPVEMPKLPSTPPPAVAPEKP